MTKNLKKAREKTKLEIITELILKTSEQFKVKPFQVNKVQFWDYVEANNVKDVTEWDLRKLGGFDSIRGQVYPPPKQDDRPENPLSTETVGKLKGHDLSAYIAGVIGDCAEESGIPPHELTWAEFRSWAHIYFGENDKGIVRYNITRAGGFNAIRDAYYPVMPTDNIVDKQRLLQQSKMNRDSAPPSLKRNLFWKTSKSSLREYSLARYSRSRFQSVKKDRPSGECPVV